MPRAIDKLSAVKVAKTQEPGRYGDGGGLYLIVDSSDARRWLMIFGMAAGNEKWASAVRP